MSNNSIIYLKIFGTTVVITSPTEISNWIKYDYHSYLTFSSREPELVFDLFAKPGDTSPYNNLIAKGYHKDYIIYEKGNLRVIDFFSEGLSIFDKKTKKTEIYCQDLDYLYEIFYLAFESLVGESLEKKGFTRIHCLALEKDGRANILMLPPGGGKTTLALKFLEHPTIKVLTEDILLFKKGKFYGLSFRWGVRQQSSEFAPTRLMIRRNEHNKHLIDTANLKLASKATYGKIIVGIRQLNDACAIKPASRLFVFCRMFKPMVLGLELQQSLAYFLLGNLKDFILKSKLVLKRLESIIKISFHSQGYEVFLGNNIEKNYEILTKFLNEN
ncbi:MAG: hypothetical protein WCX70_00670 [Candidatus Paceibacterota bacterium]|jgi:hypothetical protein